MSATPPPGGPDEIDAALSYVVDTTRTDTWVISGHALMTTAVWYQQQVMSGQFSANYEFGPFAYTGAGLGGNTHLPTQKTYIEIIVGIYVLRFDFTCQAPSYAQRMWHRVPTTGNYYLHDSESETGTSGDPTTFAATPIPYSNTEGSFLGYPAYLGQAPQATYNYIPTSAPIQSAAVGVRFTFTNRTSGVVVATGDIGNDATEIASFDGPSHTFSLTQDIPNYMGDVLVDDFSPHATFVGPFLSVAWHNRLSIVKVDTDFTIEIDMREELVRSGRNSVECRWMPVQWRLTAGSATLTYTDTDPEPMDSTAHPTLHLEQGGAAFPAEGTSYRYFRGWGYDPPEFLAEFSDWTMGGTHTGNDFTTFGGVTLPVTSVNTGLSDIGNGYGEIDAHSVKIQYSDDTPYPVDASSYAGTHDPWYIGGNVVGANGLFEAGVALAPQATSTISFDERWFDDTSFVRDPASAKQVAIAAAIAGWTAGIAGSGTAYQFPGTPPAILTHAGFVAGTAPAVGYASAFFSPWAIVNPTLTVGPESHNWPEWYIACETDPFYTIPACGRKIGQLTWTITQKVLPSITLSVSSDAMGGSNTDTFAPATDMGNWSANRYLVVDCTGISLASGHFATLTLRTHDLRDIVYTLKPDPSTGVATIDLATPDNWSSFALGQGPGLWNPVPRMNATAGSATTYIRVVNDTTSANLLARIISVTLTVPGALETFDITAIQFDTPHTGFSGWSDALGDGSGFTYEQAAAHPSSPSPFHFPFLGSQHVLVDGKHVLKYPHYAKWPLTSFPAGTHQDYWDTPLMVDDLIDDLTKLGTGLSATFTATFAPAGAPVAISSRNMPIGLLAMDDVRYNQGGYSAWSAGTNTYDFITELTSLRFPLYCCNYDLTARRISGGSWEGLAYDRATKQILASGTLTITHVLAPGGVRESTNFPTGSFTVSTDAGGFWRVPTFFDPEEVPKIKRQLNPVPLPYPARSPFTTSELSYNHFVAIISTVVPGVTNLATMDGRYHVAGPLYDLAGGPAGIQYWQSPAAAPGQWTTGGGVVPDTITSDVDDNNPCLMQDSRGRLWCAFDRESVGALVCWSDDDGDTWSDPVMAIANGQYPIIRAGKDGSIFTAAFVDDGTSSGTGTIQAYWQPAADATPSATLTFKDGSGTAIAVQAGAFGLDQLVEPSGRWALTVLAVGDSAPSTWLCSDDAGMTWLRTP